MLPGLTRDCWGAKESEAGRAVLCHYGWVGSSASCQRSSRASRISSAELPAKVRPRVRRSRARSIAAARSGVMMLPCFIAARSRRLLACPAAVLIILVQLVLKLCLPEPSPSGLLYWPGRLARTNTLFRLCNDHIQHRFNPPRRQTQADVLPVTRHSMNPPLAPGQRGRPCELPSTFPSVARGRSLLTSPAGAAAGICCLSDSVAVEYDQNPPSSGSVAEPPQQGGERDAGENCAGGRAGHRRRRGGVRRPP